MISKKWVGGILALVLAYYLSNKNCCFRKKEGKIVETKTGSVKGIISSSRDGREFYEWLGIPYAKPPVGKLRFASPQPIERWDGIRDGSSYGNVCAQLDLFSKKNMGHEDCLYLNVYVPKNVKDPKKLLPVMFWIHGGYFVCGSGSQYKPDFFMDEDVVVVSTNYRVGALGFLNTGDKAARGNMGLKDQSMALKWVSENIASFGGDPKQITIFGESAGSGSVHYHVLSPMSRGLMHRAIAQSGTALNVWAIMEDPVPQAKRFAAKFNCPTESSTEMIECLRRIDSYEMMEAHRETTQLRRTKEMVFVPSVESIQDEETFLGEQPLDLLNSGRIAKIPFLIGHNKDEGLLFGHGIRTDADFRHSLETDIRSMADVGLFLNETEVKFIEDLKEFYFENGKPLDLLEQFPSTLKVLTDRWFGYGIYKTAALHAKYAPVQFYYYNKNGPSLYDFIVLIEGRLHPMVEIVWGLFRNWFKSTVFGIAPVSYGVCHADDIAMLFEFDNIFNVRQSSPHYGFSKDLVNTWASYASLPNVADVKFRGEKLPILDPKGEFMVIEIKDVPEVKRLPTEDRMRFWDSLYKKYL